MFGLLLLAFLVVPLVELYVIIQVAGGLGVLETIGLLILVSVVGAWLVKFQGLSILRSIQKQLAGGQMPGDSLIDGGLVLFAGALMLTPGFVTDSFGVLLLLPPTRAPIRGLLKRRFTGRITTLAGGSFTPEAPPGERPSRHDGVVDVDGRESTDPDDQQGLREWRP